VQKLSVAAGHAEPKRGVPAHENPEERDKPHILSDNIIIPIIVIISINEIIKNGVFSLSKMLVSSSIIILPP